MATIHISTITVIILAACLPDSSENMTMTTVTTPGTTTTTTSPITTAATPVSTSAITTIPTRSPTVTMTTTSPTIIETSTATIGIPKTPTTPPTTSIPSTTAAPTITPTSPTPTVVATTSPTSTSISTKTTTTITTIFTTKTNPTTPATTFTTTPATKPTTTSTQTITTTTSTTTSSATIPSIITSPRTTTSPFATPTTESTTEIIPTTTPTITTPTTTPPTTTSTSPNSITTTLSITATTTSDTSTTTATAPTTTLTSTSISVKTPTTITTIFTTKTNPTRSAITFTTTPATKPTTTATITTTATTPTTTPTQTITTNTLTTTSSTTIPTIITTPRTTPTTTTTSPVTAPWVTTPTTESTTEIIPTTPTITTPTTTPPTTTSIKTTITPSTSTSPNSTTTTLSITATTTSATSTTTATTPTATSTTTPMISDTTSLSTTGTKKLPITATSTTTATTTSTPKTSLLCPEERIHNLTFPETRVGSSTTSIELCIERSSFLPVIRQCLFNGTWGEIQGECTWQPDNESLTTQLHNITQLSKKTEAINTVKEITQTIKNYSIEAVDVHFISKILYSASNDVNISQSPENFTQIVSNVMEFDQEVLRKSQKLLNSTDNILYSLDRMLLNAPRKTFPEQHNLLIDIVDTSNLIVGKMITRTSFNNDISSFKVMPLYRNNFTEQLTGADFEAAFVIPQFFTENSSYYFMTLFQDEKLFNEEAPNTPGSWIISILMPDALKNVDPTVQIYFKKFQSNTEMGCNYWHYGLDNNLTAIQGRWEIEAQPEVFKDGFYVCSVNHTTHFGLLISNSMQSSNFIFNLITIFGTILSLIGISVIFLTAITFKNWINNPTNKVIVNVSFSVLILIILFFISDQVPRGVGCKIVGILLHYAVLSQFCWTLVISYSTYRRLYLGLHYHIEHVMIKYCCVGWGVPVVPILCVIHISMDAYDKTDANSSQICYPKDIYLQLGVLLPVGIILSVNFIIYLLIFKELHYTQFDINKDKVNQTCAKWKSMILLFFMMGLTWIFGFLAVFIDNSLFLYLFCTLASSQGFIMFIFYILDFTNTRKLWRTKMQQIFQIKSKRKPVSSEATASTSQ